MGIISGLFQAGDKPMKELEQHMDRALNRGFCTGLEKLTANLVSRGREQVGVFSGRRAAGDRAGTAGIQNRC